MSAVFHRLADAGIVLRRVRDGENRCPCPICDRGPSDDALAIRIEGDHAVWKCHRCGWAGSACGLRQRESRPPAPAASAPRKADTGAHELARAIWREASPLSGTLGEEYLRRRACLVPPDDGDVRFFPRLPCTRLARALPALVCRVSTVLGNRGVGVHRIYLDPAGSDRALAKMRLGGADEPVCIRLWPDEEVTLSLAIAEGVETALAAARLHSPIWSAIDAGGMAKFPLLPGVETLVVFADHDDRGIRAAGACVDRWRAAGKTVVGKVPAQHGADANDVMREAAHD